MVLVSPECNLAYASGINVQPSIFDPICNKSRGWLQPPSSPGAERFSPGAERFSPGAERRPSHAPYVYDTYVYYTYVYHTYIYYTYVYYTYVYHMCVYHTYIYYMHIRRPHIIPISNVLLLPIPSPRFSGRLTKKSLPPRPPPPLRSPRLPHRAFVFASRITRRVQPHMPNKWGRV